MAELNTKEELFGVITTNETIEGNINPSGKIVASMIAPKGAKGDPGEDGITPTIGENGNWYLDEIDTGKPSRGLPGEKGETGETGSTGNGIESITLSSTSGKIKTYTILFTNGTTTTFNVSDGEDGSIGHDGKGLEFNWSGTQLGVRVEGTSEYTYVDLKGSKGDTGETGQDGVSPTVTTSKSGKVTTITITDSQGTHTATILDGADGGGSGDMLKSTYDTNENGIVDNAEKVNNHTVNADVPSDAIFTDTTYTAGTGIDITDGVISNTQTSAEWGNITGTLSNQTDLQNALNNKQNTISDLDTIRSGASLGATALQSETDPVFSASPSSEITSTDITNWNNKIDSSYHDNTKVDKVDGKGLSTNDYTTTEKNKLAGLSNYNDTEVRNLISAKYTKPSSGIPKTDLTSAVQTSLEKADSALQSYTETDPVFSSSAASNITSTDITNWNNKSTFSGNYNDLTNKPNIPSKVSELTNDSGFTTNTGTITGITMNGASKGTSGVVNLGTVITSHQDISGKQDTLVSGTNIKTIGGNSILGSGNIDISGDTLPIGSIIPYGSSTTPSNWLKCDGSAVSRTTYSELFSVIGTLYGSGDGSTTFNLPDLKGKVTIGQDTTDTDFDTIGKTGGEKTHKLTVSEIPAHDHRLYNTGGSSGRFNISKNWSNSMTDQGTQGSATGFEGGSQSHNNLQPYIVTNYIIKANHTSYVGEESVVQTSYNTSTTDTYSCNYINGIIESGSNANGNWIKYADGTMICYGRSQSNYSISISYGNVYRSDVQTINLPASFINTNYRVKIQGVAPVHVGYSVDDNKTINSCCFYPVGFVSQGTISLRSVDYIAIGRWK